LPFSTDGADVAPPRPVNLVIVLIVMILVVVIVVVVVVVVDFVCSSSMLSQTGPLFAVEAAAVRIAVVWMTAKRVCHGKGLRYD
jgi:hypothetical protein